MLDRTQEQIMQNWKVHEPPLLSICCITYNHELYISEALDSFLMQETDFPIEILIHDDASTDSTAAIIKEYEKKYSKIIKPIYQVENQYSKGGRINAQFNFPRAIGKYIALCEGDDYWVGSNKLQVQVRFLELNPEYVITYHDSQAFDEGGCFDMNTGAALKDLDSIELQKCSPLSTLTTCFRNVVNPFPFEIGMAKLGDLFIWSIIGKYGKGKFLKEIEPAMYRVHDGGIFSMQNKKKKKEMLLLTNHALYSYYLRVGNDTLAKHFLESSLKLSIKLLGGRNPVFMLIKLKSKKIIDKICRDLE